MGCEHGTLTVTKGLASEYYTLRVTIHTDDRVVCSSKHVVLPCLEHPPTNSMYVTWMYILKTNLEILLEEIHHELHRLEGSS